MYVQATLYMRSSVYGVARRAHTAPMLIRTLINDVLHQLYDMSLQTVHVRYYMCTVSKVSTHATQTMHAISKRVWRPLAAAALQSKAFWHGLQRR